MDANVIFRKTHKGLEEIERRIYRLSPRERLLLIQVDGKRSLGMLAGKAGLDQEGLDTASKLLSSGFIELAPTIRLPGPPPTRQEIPPGAPNTPLGSGLTASRPAPPAPPAPAPQRPSPQAAAMAPRQAPTQAPMLEQGYAPPRPPGLAPVQATPSPRPAQAPRSEQRPANWLTSTVAHLTNLFTGGDTEPEPPKKEVRTPVAPRPAPAPRPAERHHPAHLAATMDHEPVIDLTAEAEPRFAAHPTMSEPRPAPTRHPATAGRASVADEAMQALLAATTAHVPVVDLTEASEQHFREQAPVSALLKPASVPARPPVAKLPSPNPGEADDPTACPQRATCPGCPRCPGNSVSLARNFMKENLVRFSGKATSSLVQVLDQCRTLAELQRQFEPWLRDLLQTAEGVTEAPNLAGKLQRMLLQ